MLDVPQPLVDDAKMPVKRATTLALHTGDDIIMTLDKHRVPAVEGIMHLQEDSKEEATGWTRRRR